MAQRSKRNTNPHKGQWNERTNMDTIFDDENESQTEKQMSSRKEKQEYSLKNRGPTKEKKTSNHSSLSENEKIEQMNSEFLESSDSNENEDTSTRTSKLRRVRIPETNESVLGLAEMTNEIQKGLVQLTDNIDTQPKSGTTDQKKNIDIRFIREKALRLRNDLSLEGRIDSPIIPLFEDRLRFDLDTLYCILKVEDLCNIPNIHHCELASQINLKHIERFRGKRWKLIFFAEGLSFSVDADDSNHEEIANQLASITHQPCCRIAPQIHRFVYNFIGVTIFEISLALIRAGVDYVRITAFGLKRPMGWFRNYDKESLCGNTITPATTPPYTHSSLSSRLQQQMMNIDENKVSGDDEEEVNDLADQKCKFDIIWETKDYQQISSIYDLSLRVPDKLFESNGSNFTIDLAIQVECFNSQNSNEPIILLGVLNEKSIKSYSRCKISVFHLFGLPFGGITMKDKKAMKRDEPFSGIVHSIFYSNWAHILKQHLPYNYRSFPTRVRGVKERLAKLRYVLHYHKHENTEMAKFSGSGYRFETRFLNVNPLEAAKILFKQHYRLLFSNEKKSSLRIIDFFVPIPISLVLERAEQYLTEVEHDKIVFKRKDDEPFSDREKATYYALLNTFGFTHILQKQYYPLPMYDEEKQIFRMQYPSELNNYLAFKKHNSKNGVIIDNQQGDENRPGRLDQALLEEVKNYIYVKHCQSANGESKYMCYRKKKKNDETTRITFDTWSKDLDALYEKIVIKFGSEYRTRLMSMEEHAVHQNKVLENKEIRREKRKSKTKPPQKNKKTKYIKE